MERVFFVAARLVDLEAATERFRTGVLAAFCGAVRFLVALVLPPLRLAAGCGSREREARRTFAVRPNDVWSTLRNLFNDPRNADSIVADAMVATTGLLPAGRASIMQRLSCLPNLKLFTSLR